MTTDRETLVLGELELNDGINFDIESLTFTPATKQLHLVGNADADGEVLVDESHYSNATLEVEVRVGIAETTKLALEKLAELTDAIQECERIEDGQLLEWVPNRTESAYICHVISAEYTEMPITVNGDLAGWFIQSPVVKVKFTMKPFLTVEELVAKASTESGAEPQQTLYVKEVGGDVPAEGRMVVRDASGQDRRFAEWGQDLVDSEVGNPSLLLKGVTELKVEGYAGTSSTKSGSWSTNVVKATLTPTATVFCATGPIKHVGSFRLKLRCQVDGEGALFRVTHRVGTGNWMKSMSWVGSQITSQWMEFDFGDMFFDEVERGEQSVEFRIEGKVEEINCNGYIDFLGLTPTRRYGIARAPGELESPASILIRDEFNQTAGNLNGKIIAAAGAISGPRNPEKVVDDASVGTQEWTNTENAKVVDANKAGVKLVSVGKASHYLKSTKYGFAIPVGATITGIEVSILRDQSYAREFPIEDAYVRLVKAGAIVGSNYAHEKVQWPYPEGWATYGSSSDLWGTTWTVAQINEEGFGIAVAVNSPTATKETRCQVNAFTVTVYYTVAGGETWATSGDAVDLAVETTWHTARRDEVSDASIDTGGRFAIAGSTAMVATAVTLWPARNLPAVASGEKIRGGMIARWTNIENWLFGGFELNAESSEMHEYFVLTKRVAGVATELGRVEVPLTPYFPGAIWLAVDTAGRIFLWREMSGGLELVLMREDSAFATGGGLASGKVGFYDGKTGANASARFYDNFAVWIPYFNDVCEAGQAIEVRSDGAERQNGSVWSLVPQYRGANFLLDPGKINRILVKMRRNDNWIEPDSAVTDKQSVEVFKTERFLVPR